VKNSIVEQVMAAETPEQMRSELFRLRHYDALVRSVMDAADYSGMSSEDKYTMLAYHAMKDRNRFQTMLIDDLSISVKPPFITNYENGK
jgi:hypothetical protein